MKCTNCGKELPENAKFCTGCGTTMNKGAEPAPASAPAAEPAKGSNKALLIVLIAVGGFLALCLIVAIVVIAVLFTRNKPANNPDDLTLPDGYHGVIITPDGEFEYDVIIEGENPVPEGNPYRDCYNSGVGFVLPDSGDRYYARSELERLNQYSLEVALGEIYARCGYTFDDRALQGYFDAMSWYTPMGGSPELNDYEQANAILLQIMVHEHKGTLQATGNPYLALRGDPDSQIAPDSADRYLNADDLENRSAEELDILYAEILARNGVVFENRQLQEYFSCKRWYEPLVEEEDFDLEGVSEYEDANMELTAIYQGILAGDYKPAADNKYMPYYDPFFEMVMEKSSTTKLTAQDLRGRTPEELVLIRNEIFARHGLSFNHQGLMEYFTQCSWYRPSIAPGRVDAIKTMTTLEYQNVDFIYAYEQNPYADLKNRDQTMSYRVDSDMFRVYLPEYWRDYSVVHYDYYNGLVTVSFFDSGDYYEYGCGRLFDLVVMYADDPVHYPNYEEVAVLTDGYNNYRVIAVYPTDVQYYKAHKQLYDTMLGDIQNILSTLTPRSGYTKVS